MKTFYMCFFTTILILSIFATSSVLADEIYLKNGDRISGQLLNMKDGTLTVKTSYAGDIGIKWSEIANLKTDKEISILLSDDTLIKGSTKNFEQGKIIFSMDEVDEPISFSMTDVKSINPPKEPTVKIKVRANMGVTVTKGNTERNSTHFDGEFSARTEKNRYTAGGELNSAKESGVKTESNSMGYLRYDHFVSKKWFAYSNALFEKDKFKDLNLRSLIGIGLGYQFYETPITNLSLGAGINYVNEDYIVAPDDSFSAGRWAIKFDRYFFNKAFQLFHSHEGFVSLQNTSDMFIISSTGIRVPLFEHFNATLQYNVDWDNTPSPGRDKTDTILMFTLGYQFGN